MALADQDGLAALKEMSELTGGSHIALSMAEIEQLHAAIHQKMKTSGINTVKS